MLCYINICIIYSWNCLSSWCVWASNSIHCSSISIHFSCSDIIVWSLLFCTVIIFSNSSLIFVASLIPLFCFLDLLPLSDFHVQLPTGCVLLPVGCNPLPDGCISLISVFTWVLLLKVWFGTGLWTAGAMVWPDMSWVSSSGPICQGLLLQWGVLLNAWSKYTV